MTTYSDQAIATNSAISSGEYVEFALLMLLGGRLSAAGAIVGDRVLKKLTPHSEESDVKSGGG